MAIATVRSLEQAYTFLLFAPETDRSLDVLILRLMSETWVSGAPLYTLPRFADFATYPPASYVMLWPLLGWTSIGGARWLMAVVGAVTLAGFAWAVVKYSGVETWQERAFLALTILSMNGTRGALGNGQTIFLSLCAFAFALCLLANPRRGRRAEVAAVVLLVVALVKPHLVAFFFWCILFTPGGVRVVMATCLAYGALTLLASAFQTENVLTLIAQWLERASYGATFVGEGGGNTNNLPYWFAKAGLHAWGTPVSVALLLALGVWTWVYRKADPWIQLGVAAIVGRLAVYHRFYDDPMLAFAIVALYRTGAGFPVAGMRVAAWVLLALLLAGQVAFHSLQVFGAYELDAAVLVAAFILLWGVAWWETRASSAARPDVTPGEQIEARGQA
jgi:hypothetical protein